MQKKEFEFIIFQSYKLSNYGLLSYKMKVSNTKNIQVISEVLAKYSETCDYTPVRSWHPKGAL